ncbi:MAG: class I SAM-dependent methyltransferase [Salaquimonas sp.]|nr:class I SAM-dependent methyltransferase [Salaquimonas sp.]
MKQTPEELLARAYALSDAAEAKALYRDWATTYDATMLGGLGYLTPSRTADLLAGNLAERDASILDVGCGTGLAGEALAGRGFLDIDALDYSPEMLKVAGARLHEGQRVYNRLIEADLNAPLDLANDSYDALICTGTFTHAHVGAACLDELFRILKPGGLFACTVHKDVWQPAGFAEKVAELEKSGRLETLAHEPGTYFADSAEPDGFYILWRSGQ